MNSKVGQVIFEAIKEECWVEVKYGEDNKSFWIGIKDIDLDNKIIECEEFNSYINGKITIHATIFAEKIIKAKVLKGTYFKINKALIDKIDRFPDKSEWLSPNHYNDNILKYLIECSENDNDPCINEHVAIAGLTFDEILKYKDLKISDDQFDKIIKLVLNVNKEDAQKALIRENLAISTLAISIGEKKYVIAYRNIQINPYTRMLHYDDRSTINKSFLIEGKKYSIFNYIHSDPSEFVRTFDTNANEYIELIRQNLSGSEKLDLRNEIFIIKKQFICDLTPVTKSIYDMAKNKSMTKPIQAYFGKNITKRKAQNKDPYIVLQNKNANIDQIRVVYNTMVNFITYVQGPPGTGKTKTIINVLLSALANDKNCLICSNNNKPINDIYDSIHFENPIAHNEITFPILRLGNKEENLKALARIKEIYLSISEVSTKYTKKQVEELKCKALSSYKELKGFLSDHEDRLLIEQKEECISKLYKEIKDSRAAEFLKKQLHELAIEKEQYQFITNEEAQKYVIPVDSNSDFYVYLEAYSMYHLKKLEDSDSKDLMDIILCSDEEKASKDFNQYIKIEDNMKKLIEIFPIVLCTNISCGKLGDAIPKFDLCIMDESGQCNIATSLVPIIRAKSLLLVGDTNQLRPVVVLEDNLNDKLMTKYKIQQKYSYIENSVLSLMKNVDQTSKNIILRYHYRCPKKIIEFCNSTFYNNELIVENKNDASLQFFDVKNLNQEERNTSIDEASAIVDLIKNNGYKNTTIITPFKGQADLINIKLKENNIADVKAGTIHSVQGAESNTIIMSAALSPKTAKKTYDWMKNNEELINVGLSRAKKNFILFGDYESICKLDGTQDSIFKRLTEYTRSDGNIAVIKPKGYNTKNLSNNSVAEKELYETLKPFFDMKYDYKIERNVKVSQCLKISEDKYKDYYSKAEFDLVIFKNGVMGRKEPKLVVEIDGGEHIILDKTIKRDRTKEIICGTVKIPILRIANSQTKDYNCLIQILSSCLGEQRPLTLFDLEEGKDE